MYQINSSQFITIYHTFITFFQKLGREKNYPMFDKLKDKPCDKSASTPGCSRLGLFPVPPGASGKTDQK